MGSETQQRLCLKGLQNSAGYLQSKISDRIDTRYTPRLRFELDEGVKKSLAISQMLHELLPDTNSSEPIADDESDAVDREPDED
jgi:ribosome-binding factor A